MWICKDYKDYSESTRPFGLAGSQKWWGQVRESSGNFTPSQKENRAVMKMFWENIFSSRAELASKEQTIPCLCNCFPMRGPDRRDFLQHSVFLHFLGWRVISKESKIIHCSEQVQCDWSIAGKQAAARVPSVTLEGSQSPLSLHHGQDAGDSGRAVWPCRTQAHRSALMSSPKGAPRPHAQP